MRRKFKRNQKNRLPPPDVNFNFSMFFFFVITVNDRAECFSRFTEFFDHCVSFSKYLLIATCAALFITVDNFKENRSIEINLVKTNEELVRVLHR